MKNIERLLLFFIVMTFVVGCDKDPYDISAVGEITEPSNVSAIFDITQDNSGLVTIIPQAENVAKFEIKFGDVSDEIATEFALNESVSHIYGEGIFTITITAVGVTGLTSTITQDLNVTFKAPENLAVNITQDDINPKTVRVSATADFATVMEIYFGDQDPDMPSLAMLGEEIEHTYELSGNYTIRVVAKSAGAATVEYTEVVVITDAADPVEFPIDFESFTVNYAFGNFGNAVSTVIDNPDATGINASAKVGQFVKNAGAETWAGSLLTLGNIIDFSSDKLFKLKVWSPKAGAIVKLKVENLNDGDIGHEIDAVTTVANTWELLSFDFSAIDVNMEYQKVVLFFDFGNVGDDAIYYFDDIKQDEVATGENKVAGTWRLVLQAGALGVGPELGDVSWWSSTDEDLTVRSCLFDDTFVFHADGTFKNELGGATWIEEWQGGGNECAAPVAPHDGSIAATYIYDETAGTVTLDGQGSYLGIPKPFNGGELDNPLNAPASITYDISFMNGDTMIVDISIGGGWWRYRLVKDGGGESSPLSGSWQIAPEAGAIGVGPELGDVSWWSNTIDDVTTRACFFDDDYIFGLDGSFQNVLGAATWIEGWQGGGDACDAPVAPHDGSTTATFSYDENASQVTLDGTGSFLGIPKAFNGGELDDPGNAPASITYDLTLSDGNTRMIADININGGWWRFNLVKK